MIIPLFIGFHTSQVVGCLGFQPSTVVLTTIAPTNLRPRGPRLHLWRQHGDVKGAPFGFLGAEKLVTTSGLIMLGGSRYRKWLGSPPFISHKKAIYKGSHNPTLGDLWSPWLLTTYPSHGMILQVGGQQVDLDLYWILVEISGGGWDFLRLRKYNKKNKATNWWRYILTQPFGTLK